LPKQFKSSIVTDDVPLSLHQRLSSGDEIAFELFFRQYQPKLFAYIFKVVKSREIAEELVLDMFVKIWSAKEILSEVENVDAFLYRMAINKSLDFLRTAAREKKLRLLLNEHMQHEQAEMSNTHDVKEYEQQIVQCLQMLTNQQQLVLNLSREEGLTHDQIAARLNLSKNTVKNHVVGALRSLREFIRKGNLSVFIFF